MTEMTEVAEVAEVTPLVFVTPMTYHKDSSTRGGAVR